jgi:large subunit ribosomal protein L22
MEAVAHAKYVHIAPQKMRLVVDLIRGKKVEDAYVILQGTQKKGSPIVEKLLRSAVANALYTRDGDEEAPRVDVDQLFVRSVTVDGGPVMKRFRPRPMGRANRIRKRTSHITIVVGSSVKRGAA